MSSSFRQPHRTPLSPPCWWLYRKFAGKQPANALDRIRDLRKAAATKTFPSVRRFDKYDAPMHDWLLMSCATKGWTQYSAGECGRKRRMRDMERRRRTDMWGAKYGPETVERYLRDCRYFTPLYGPK
jgi:hypothetical protein